MPSGDFPGLQWFFFLAWAGSAALCLYYETARLRQALNSPAGALGWFFDWNAETTLPLLVLVLLPVLWMLRRGPRGPLPGQQKSRVPAGGDHKAVAQEGAGSRAVALLQTEPGARAASSGIPVPAAGLAGHSPRPDYLVSLRGRMWGSLIIFFMSLFGSAQIGFRPVESQQGGQRVTVAFSELPPAYHDEFSYLLQADTFLAGRLAWPARSTAPDLFHQFHVLNVPVTASRYFPWTGLWIAPFRYADHPVWGHWLAGAIASVFFYLSLCQLLPLPWSLTAGALIAISPGIALFSNLLLAHHPVLLALSVFLWAFLRLMTAARVRFGWIAAVGLTLAMLGRPMTAAGFALPFGLWLAWQGCCVCVPRLRRSAAPDRLPAVRFTVQVVLAFVVCLSAGLLSLMILNRATTGSWTTTAYQMYTDTWTPRHRYGFNNVVSADLSPRSELLDLVPDAVRRYDRWATNLTPARAWQNVGHRLMASLQWSLAVVPLMLFLTVAAGRALVGRGDVRWRLIWLSVISLHIVHVPYWFDGILHWHYVFETAPLLLMLVGAGCISVSHFLSRFLGPRTAGIWILALLISGLAPGWLNADGLWGRSKVSLAVNEQAFSRVRMDQFRWLIHSPAVQRPALILVDESGTDPQLSYVINPPDGDVDVLVCRLPERRERITDLQQAFPDRSLYIFDPTDFRLERAAP